MLGQSVAVRLLYRDACAPRRRQSSSSWRRDNSILRTRGCCRGRHREASQHLQCCYFIISARMNPCLISMSLVAMARATSTTTIPTSRAVKSNLGGAPPMTILLSRWRGRTRPHYGRGRKQAFYSRLPYLWRCSTYSIIKGSGGTFNCLASAGSLIARRATNDAGFFVCWSFETMSASASQAPMIVVQLVRPSRLCSGCCEATGTSGRCLNVPGPSTLPPLQDCWPLRRGNRRTTK